MREANGADTGEFTLLTAARAQYYRELVPCAEQMTDACGLTSCRGQDGEKNLYTLFGVQLPEVPRYYESNSCAA